MRKLCLIFVAVNMLLAYRAVNAQTPADSGTAVHGEKVPKTDDKITREETLPAPLDRISGNFRDLEETGYFKISKMEYGRSELHRDDSLIWTVQVVKPLSCRHALQLLHQLSDVRFYRTEEDWYKQLYMTHLYHSAALDSRAVRKEILDKYEEFHVWVVLSQRDLYSLTHEDADTVVFRELRKRHSAKPKDSIADITTDFPQTRFGYTSKSRSPKDAVRSFGKE